MKKSLWLPTATGVLATGVLLVSGCGKTPEVAENGKPAETTSTKPASNLALTTPSDPKEVVRLFLDSMRQGNGAQLSSLLSTLAREEIKKNKLEIAPLGSPMATFQILEAAAKDGGMLVESTWTEPEQPGQPATELEVVWELRQEPAGWRICAMAVDPKNGDEPQIVDFERLEQEPAAQDPAMVAQLPAASMSVPPMPNAPTGFGAPQQNSMPPANGSNGFQPNNSLPPINSLPPMTQSPMTQSPSSSLPPSGNFAPTAPSNGYGQPTSGGYAPPPSGNFPPANQGFTSGPNAGGQTQQPNPYGNSNQLPPIVPGGYAMPPAPPVGNLPPSSNNSNQMRR